jgi:hypothetical protein
VPLPRIPEGELPPAVRAALEQVRDFVPSFDHPGYYALLAFVHEQSEPPGWRNGTVEVQSWEDMLERPAELRGRAVTLDGTIGLNKPPFTLPDYPRVGEFWRLELREATRPDGPVKATVICTQDTSGLPVGARIRITGYFVMLRQWEPNKYAALLVARGPSRVETSLPPAPTPFPWPAALIIVGVGLLAAIVLLRGAATRRTRTDLHTLHARQTPSETHADALQAWFENAGPDDRPANEPPPDAERRG